MWCIQCVVSNESCVRCVIYTVCGVYSVLFHTVCCFIQCVLYTVFDVYGVWCIHCDSVLCIPCVMFTVCVCLGGCVGMGVGLFVCLFLCGWVGGCLSVVDSECSILFDCLSVSETLVDVNLTECMCLNLSVFESLIVAVFVYIVTSLGVTGDFRTTQFSS